MKTLCKTMTKLMILCALSALPLCAQIPNGLKFTTSFPFYVGNQYMPAGLYTVTKPNENDRVLLVRGPDGTRSVFINYIPTETLTPVNQGKVSFHEYGDTAFLASFTVTADTSGFEVLPGKPEKETASGEHEQALNQTVPLEAIRAGN